MAAAVVKAMGLDMGGGSSTEPDELLHDPERLPRGSGEQPFRAKFLCLAGCCSLVALAGGVGFGGIRSARLPRGASLDLSYAAKDATACEDTVGWTNGYIRCNLGFYDGHGCEPTGLSCEAYANSPEWCAVSDMLGPTYNYPELNCCVCGGGTMPNSTVLDRVEKTLSDVSGSPQCKDHVSCIFEGLTGECCPTTDGTQLDCCTEPTQKECTDSPHWTNGYVACLNSLGEEDGCTAGGLSCEGYVKQGICNGGAVIDEKVLDGRSGGIGGMYNHPELNCCECGKLPGSVANYIT